MDWEELLEKAPELKKYIKNMPPEVKRHCVIRVLPPGRIIHQKNFELDYFAFVCIGIHRVINEFENGNVYMIEKNEPVDFVGEVTILAGQRRTSVTLETVTECTLLQMPRKDFERWVENDLNLLTLVARKVAFKLYRSSSRNGATLFYPPNFLLLEYMVQYAGKHMVNGRESVTVPFTRRQLEEELGISIKTLNRTVRKLKDTGFLGISKGKLTMNQAQYELAMGELEVLRRGSGHW